jgi:flagellar capping protein FliD
VQQQIDDELKSELNFESPWQLSSCIPENSSSSSFSDNNNDDIDADASPEASSSSSSSTWKSTNASSTSSKSKGVITTKITTHRLATDEVMYKVFAGIETRLVGRSDILSQAHVDQLESVFIVSLYLYKHISYLHVHVHVYILGTSEIISMSRLEADL